MVQTQILFLIGFFPTDREESKIAFRCCNLYLCEFVKIAVTPLDAIEAFEAFEAFLRPLRRF